MTLDQMMTVPAERLAELSKMGIEILPDRKSIHEHFARTIADTIKEHNARGERSSFILPVGPTEHYPILVETCNRERISWKHVYTFNMDEYLDWQGRPVPVDHPMSFEGFMHTNLFGLLDEELRIPDANVAFPHPFRIDEISERIAQVGGVDICFGGIGFRGHVAFNEPPVSWWDEVSLEEFRESKTRVVTLNPETFVINSMAGTGGNYKAVPPMAVTLGMNDILGSRKIRLYCEWPAWQPRVMRMALMGEVTVNHPATLCQEHPDCTIITDAATAAPCATVPA